MKQLIAMITGSVLAGLLIGCSQDTKQAKPISALTLNRSPFLLSMEPQVATSVIKVRENASDGDDVVIVGRIGGSENPWIEGRAAFSIVDGSLKACSDIEGDNCPQPWDYCCETSKLPNATALVKIIDDGGNLVTTDARELLEVKELSTVIVKGKAKRDDAGNLTVLANSVYIKKK